MIIEARKKQEAIEAQEMLPLIRLKIEYGIGPGGQAPPPGQPAAYQVYKSRNIDANFQGRIANIEDYLQWHKKDAKKAANGPKKKKGETT